MLLPPDQDWLGTLAESPAAEVKKILLVGWEGTLSPRSAGPQPTPLPPEVIALVDPLVSEAMTLVRTAFSGLALPCAKDGYSLEKLVRTLQRRLGSLYVLPVALGHMQFHSPERMGADRIARTLAEEWVAGVTLFLERLKTASERIVQWRGWRALPTIASLTAAASDIHGSAGGVIEIEFAGGDRIFYKPRPVTGELLWAELNAAVARADERGGVMAARVLPGGHDARSSYGWMEAFAPGSSDAGEHWQKAGALLCLAQHAGMSDLHMANVMATSRGPAVLDAECLADPSAVCEAGDETTALLATGLLPLGRGTREQPLPDISGLFGAGAEVRGVLVPHWSSTPAGGATVLFGAARLLDQANRHTALQTPLACLSGMLEGYCRCARALASVRHDLLAEGGWVDRLDRLHCPRVVLRDTLTYGWLMSQSLFAGRIGSGESRRVTLRQMLVEAPCALPLAISAEVLDAEVEALLRFCVPRFHVASGTRDLACEDGRVLAREAVPCTPAIGVRRRLEAISAADVEGDVGSVLSTILFRARAVESSRSG